MIEMEAWRVYGSKSEYLKAPRHEATRILLILQAQHKIEREQAETQAREANEQRAAWERLMQGNSTTK